MRPAGSGLVNNYTPIIADASATYKLDSFPLYPGTFPIKLAGEYINNVGANQNNNNNQGYWVGVTFGKSGKKHAWDISYRYEYLEADAMYDQLVDDDNGAYYQNAPTGGAVGYYWRHEHKRQFDQGQLLDNRLVDFHIHLLSE